MVFQPSASSRCVTPRTMAEFHPSFPMSILPRALSAAILSDTLSVVGEVNYDLDGNTLSRGSIGTELRHTPDLTTIVEYRYIDAGGNQLLEIGWEYQLTRKYKVALRPQWDFAANDFRAISLILTRTFPDFDVTFLIRRDEIADQTTVGASLDLVEF